MAKVKGTILVPLVKALRTRKDEARALLAPDLHRYLTERILVTDWYPEVGVLLEGVCSNARNVTAGCASSRTPPRRWLACTCDCVTLN